MKSRILPNYLKTYRKQSNLSERELGLLLGYANRGQASRHEHSKTYPPLEIALAYEAIYRVPVSTLFLGIHDSVKTTIEKRLTAMEKVLQGRGANDVGAESIARKLEWMMERRQR
jgi:transcriptional regulator with XRE-family HTH domain